MKFTYFLHENEELSINDNTRADEKSRACSVKRKAPWQ